MTCAPMKVNSDGFVGATAKSNCLSTWLSARRTQVCLFYRLGMKDEVDLQEEPWQMEAEKKSNLIRGHLKLCWPLLKTSSPVFVQRMLSLREFKLSFCS